MALQICRICGGNTELKSILDQGPEMIEKLLKCANIQVYREDSLPKFICIHCDQHLDLSYNLRKQSEETARRLRKELKVKNQPDADGVEEPARETKVETATSSIFCKVERKVNLQFTSLPSSNQSATESCVESSTVIACKKEKKPIHLPCKSEQPAKETVVGSSAVVPENVVFKKEEKPNLHFKMETPSREFVGETYTQVSSNVVYKGEEQCVAGNLTNVYQTVPTSSSNVTECTQLDTVSEPSDIDEEEFQMIDNSNPVLENESNDAYEVYGSLEARPPSATPAQNDFKMVEVKGILPDQIAMDANDAAEQNYLQIQQSVTNDMFVEGNSRAYLNSNHGTSPSESTSFVDNGSIDILSSADSATEDFDNRNLSSRSKSPSPLKCPTCSRLLYTQKAYVKHLREHDKNEYQCSKCTKSFNSRARMERHEEIHNETAVHQCPHCELFYRAKGTLDKHIKKAHTISNKSKKYTCNICKQKFTQLDDLKLHMEIHSDEYSYTCTTCFQSFKRQYYLDNHVIRHHPESKIHQQHSPTQQWTPGVNIPEDNQCNYCGKQLKTFSAYKNHLQSMHPNKKPPHKCKTCNKKYFQLKSLTRHESLQHSGGDTFHKCDICLKSFKKLSHLTLHKVVHSKLQHSCSICTKKFRHKNSLNFHMRYHNNKKQFKCGICSEEFVNPESLTRHAKKNHTDATTSSLEKDVSELINENDLLEDSPASSYMHISSKDVLKPVKDNEYKVVELQEHDPKIYSSSSNKDILWDSQKNTPNQNQSVYCGKQLKKKRSTTKQWTPGVNIPGNNQCQYCGIQLKTFETYKQHVRRLHPNENPYKCKTCNKRYLTVNCLTRHENLKHSERPYKCDICLRSFKQYGTLNRHKVLHSKIQPQHLCSICPAKYRRKDNLNIHMRIHSQQHFDHKRPHKCDICLKSFKQLSTLTQHIVLHSKFPPLQSCSVCPAKFRHKRNLNAHMQRHTKKKPFKCGTCSTVFARECFLKTHIKKFHSYATTSRNINPLEKVESELINKGGRLEDSPASSNMYISNKDVLKPAKDNSENDVVELTKPPHKYNALKPLTRHESLKHSDDYRPYKCDICSFSFKNVFTLKRHKKMLHFDLQPQFSCLICPAKFRRTDNLESHMRSHTKPFKCGTCSKAFSRAVLLKTHIQKFHSDTTTPSLEKDQSELTNKDDRLEDIPALSNMHISNKDVLKPAEKPPEKVESELINKGDRLEDSPASSNMCISNKDVLKPAKDNQENYVVELTKPPHKYNAVKTLTQHESLKHSDRPYKCDICSLSFKNLPTLTRHTKVLHSDLPPQFSCLICPAKFRRTDSLDAHMRSHTKPFKCGTCSKVFARAYLLKTHIKKFHSDTTTSSLEKDQSELINKDDRLEDIPALSNMHISNKVVLKPAEDNPEDCVGELKGDDHKMYSTLNKEISWDSQKNTPKRNQCGFCGKQLKTSATYKNHLLVHSTNASNKLHEICHPENNLQQQCSTTQQWTPGVNIPGNNQCQYCGIQLKTFETYKQHVRRLHPNEKPYKCKTCNKRYLTVNCLTRHESLNHSGTVRPYKCDICLRSFKQYGTLNRHKVLHSKIQPQHLCSMCPAKYRRKDTLTAHMRIYHSSHATQHSCLICPAKFRKKQNLVLHKRSHTNAKPFKCGTCLRVFASSDLLQTHTKKFHSDINFYSVEKDELVNKDNRLEDSISSSNMHISNKKVLHPDLPSHLNLTPFKCGTCSKVFAHAYLLQTHIKKIHSDTTTSSLEKNQSELINKDDRLEDIPASSNMDISNKDVLKPAEDNPEDCVGELKGDDHKMYSTLNKKISWDSQKNTPKRNQCGFCGKQLKTSATYKNHLLVHTTNAINKLHEICHPENNLQQQCSTTQQWTPGVNIPGNNQCQYCGIQLKTFETYKQHVRRLHPNERPYKCKTCNKRYLTVNCLTRHESLNHSGTVRPYKCDICLRSFKQYGTLNRHKVLHSKIKPQHLCSICPAKYRRKDSLTAHMRSYHSSHATHSCLICPAKFRKNQNLVLHMRSHTNAKPFKCATCLRVFASSDSLQIHTKKDHSDINFYSVEKDELVNKVNRLEDSISSSNMHISNKKVLHPDLPSHLNLSPFKCGTCSKIFAHAYLLKTHIKKFHSDTTTSSLEKNQSELINKDDRLEDIPASSCMHISNKDVLKPAEDNPEDCVGELKGDDHKMYSTLNKEISWDSQKNTPKRNQCGFCGKQLKTSATYKNHLLVHTTNASNKLHEICHPENNLQQQCSTTQQWTPGVNSPEKNQCLYCGIQLKTFETYKQHVRRLHPNEKPYKCKICNKGYLTVNCLTRHESLKHSGNDRPYKCDICLRSFKQFATLNRHKVLHSKIQPQHLCSICPAKYRRKDNLTAHMRIYHSSHHIKNHSDTITSGNTNTLEKYDSELIKDNRLKYDCAETFEYESNMCIDFPEESQQQLPSTSKTQIRNTESSIIPQNIVNENIKSISLPMESILYDASNSSTSNIESNFIEFIKEEYQIVEQNIGELKTDKAELRSIYNIEDFI